MLSNEALFLLGARRATGGAGAFRVERGDEAPLPGVEDLALRADRAANVRGAELLGFERTIAAGGPGRRATSSIVADEDLDGARWPSAREAGAVIVVGTTLPPGRARRRRRLPIANFAEEEGTFTNLRGRVQRFLQAKAAPGLARPSWCVLGDLLGAMGERGVFLPIRRVRALAGDRPAFAGMTYDDSGCAVLR